jgi:hypothetical protein
MTNPYIDLAHAEEGSPEHLDAVTRIQAMEKANAKAQESVIKGTGRSRPCLRMLAGSTFLMLFPAMSIGHLA